MVTSVADAATPSYVVEVVPWIDISAPSGGWLLSSLLPLVDVLRWMNGMSGSRERPRRLIEVQRGMELR